MTQTCRQTSGFDRRRGDPERGRQYRCADGSDAANPRAKRLRQIEFAAERVMARLPIGHSKELRGRTQLLPQLSCAGIGLARFRRGESFDGLQHRAQGAANSSSCRWRSGVVRQQRQLVQPLLQLRGRFRHRRAGGGPMTGLAPAGDGFFNEPGLGVMLREELGLAVHQLGEWVSSASAICACNCCRALRSRLPCAASCTSACLKL